MNVRTFRGVAVAIGCGAAIVGGVAIGSRSSGVSTVGATTAATQARGMKSSVASAVHAVARERMGPASQLEGIDRYRAMRDDPNPIPRLAWIEEAARADASPVTTDLLAQAMVDTDERVRSRAQALFDRRLAEVGAAGPR